MQWTTIFKKEMLEYWRNFSWVWVPLVFILVAIMDPLTTYYLTKIIDAVGGLLDGTVIDLPETTPQSALFMSLSAFSMYGVLIIVLISMGIIAGERKSGVAELVLVKPVSYLSYITSKWAAKLVLILASYLIAMLTSWYYVNLLFGEITFGMFVQVLLFYSLWLTFVLTVTIFVNTLFKSPAIVGFVSIAILIVMSIFNSIFNNIITWFPNSLSGHILTMLNTNEIPTELWGTSSVILVLIVVLLFGSLFTFRGKEMANN